MMSASDVESMRAGRAHPVRASHASTAARSTAARRPQWNARMVHVNGLAVERDRPFDRRRHTGSAPSLIGVAQHETCCAERLAEQCGGEPGCIDKMAVATPARPEIVRLIRSVGSEKSGFCDSPGNTSARLSPLWCGSRRPAPSCCDHHHSPPKHQVSPRAATRIAMMSSAGWKANVTVTAPPFWRSPHVEMPTPFPSRCAAIPGWAPMVMMPVPPMPVTMTP